MKLPRTCSTDGCPELAVYRGRCRRCARLHDTHQRRTVPTKATRTSAERQRRAAAVEAHRVQHGDWCPGWAVPAHSATDLTADHLVAIADGGDPHGQLDVLCRPCNSRKGWGRPPAALDRNPAGKVPRGPQT